MDQQELATLPQAPKKSLTVRICGIGSAGIRILEPIIADPPLGAKCAVVCADEAALSLSSAPEKLHLKFKPIRGLGTGGDPDRGRLVAEEQIASLKALCQGTDVVILVAGLGGGAGTGIAPVMAKAAKDSGALVLAFAAMPFEFEKRRHEIARQGLRELKDAADGVICFPNERILGLVDENASVVEAFKAANRLLAEGVCGFCDLLSHSGLIEIHFEDVHALVHGRHGESTLAVAEAAGATRSREVTERLLAHPMIEKGQAISGADVVLVSLRGGPDLTMAEVNRVIQDIGAHCEQAQVIVGASIQEQLRERLVVTLIAFRKETEAEKSQAAAATRTEGLGDQLLNRTSSPARTGSRFVPPAPSLSPDEMRKLMACQRPGNGRTRKSSARMKQAQLPLDIVSKGRFDKSEPTIYNGEDLDIPTYLRRNVALN